MLYENDLKISPRQANSTRRFIESVISNYDEAHYSEPIKSEPYRSPYQEDASIIMENKALRDNALNRYHSFSETVRNVLVTEALYKIYKESVPEQYKSDSSNISVMRAIVNDYVQEHGYDYILNRMKTASIAMCETYRVITKNIKSILEEVDKTDPNTFVVTPAMRDEFFNQLDYSNDEEISKAINSRVSDAMQDFVNANTKDHDNITSALKDAQDKIAESPEEDTDLREHYEMKGKRQVAEIRNAPKGLLHGMVSAMCESVLKNDSLHNEFMTEGHLDIGKITSRVSLMYTFLEMLNTTRLETITENYLSDIIKNLSK